MQSIGSIISLPNLVQRCSELAGFINKTPLQELAHCFPLIVDHILGINSNIGWNLRELTKQNAPKETDALLKLLGPTGPLLQLAYRLMTDPNLRYEFLLAHIPRIMVRRISLNQIPSYFPKSVPFRFADAVTPVSMYLTPFEYYFFAFASIQTGTITDQHGVLGGLVNLADTVYTNLLGEFLEYFFPCNGRGVPPIIVSQELVPDENYTSGSSSGTGAFNQRESQSSAGNPRRSNLPKLLKPSIFQDESNTRELAFAHELSSVDRETWRSETIFNIFLVMWLNLDKGDGMETLLSSIDMVKSVRMLTRHLHYFNNTVTVTILHPLEDIKKTLFPVFQRKLYSLLRYLFGHWPMDSSFRMVYETWLSYIQPWRYTKYESGGYLKEKDDFQIDQKWEGFISANVLFYTYLFQDILIRLAKSDLTAYRNAHMLFRVVKIYASQKVLKPTLKALDGKMLQICNNKDAQYEYTTSPTNPLRYRGDPPETPISLSTLRYRGDPLASATPMKYRDSLTTPSPFRFRDGLAATPNPLRYRGNPATSNAFSNSKNSPTTLYSVRSTERENTNYNELHYRDSPGNDSVTGLMPYSSFYTTVTSPQMRQMFREFEGPNATYISLFSPTYRQIARDIITSTDKAIFSTKRFLANPANRTPTRKSTGLFSSFFQSGESQPNLGPNPNTVAEKEKVLALLESSKEPLGQFFDIPILPVDPQEISMATNLQNGNEMEPVGRLLSRSRVVDMSKRQYVGNPELAPLRADENAVAIRLLAITSQLMNTMVIPMIEKKYFEANFLGSVTRAVFAAPVFYEDLYKKGPAQSVKIKRYLPPRVSLRPLASTFAIVNFVAFILLGLLFSLKGTSWIVWPLGIYLIYILLTVFMEPADNLPNLRSQFQDFL